MTSIFALMIVGVFAFAGELDESNPPPEIQLPAVIHFQSLLAHLISASKSEQARLIASLIQHKGKDWTQAQKKHLLKNFLKNSDGSYSGAVWASPSAGRNPNGNPGTPDYDPGEPDYRFHWNRDSAIATLAVADLYDFEDTTPEERSEYLEVLKGYVKFTRELQLLPIDHEWLIVEKNGHMRWVAPNTPGAIAVRYGEAKHRVAKHYDGSNNYKWVPAKFSDEWGRPQNDGPALRASATSKILNIFQREKDEKTKKRESTSDLDWHINIAKTNLLEDAKYVMARWSDPSFDLWEEVFGDHFFTRVVQSEGLANTLLILKKEPELHRQLIIDMEIARNAIEASLELFWDEGSQHLFATRNIKGGMRKDTDIDMAIVLAANRRKKGPFSPSDPKIQATVAVLWKAFRNDPAFEINRSPGIPGVAMGRYPKDPWTGERRLINPDGSPASAGRAWVITTEAMVENLFLTANTAMEEGEIKLNELSRPFYELVLGTNFRTEWNEMINKGETITISRSTEPLLFNEFISSLHRSGQSFGARLLSSGIRGGASTYEQFSGDSTAGKRYVGAEGLTWNCAQHLSGVVKSHRQLETARKVGTD